MEKKEIDNDIQIEPGSHWFPADYESDEKWRKSRYSCSGSGRIDKSFDLKNYSMMNIVLKDE